MPYVIGIDAMTQIEVYSLFSFWLGSGGNLKNSFPLTFLLSAISHIGPLFKTSSPWSIYHVGEEIASKQLFSLLLGRVYKIVIW